MDTYELPALSALLTIIVAVWTELHKRNVQSPNPLHAKDSMMAFQFARNDEQIKDLFVNKGQKPASPFIRKVRYLTRLDYLFIVFYTLFTVSFAWEATKEQPSIWNYLVLLIAPLIGLFDMLENIQLLRILDTVEKNTNATFQPALRRLSIFTWIKWEGTGFLMLLLTPFLWQQPGCWSKGLAILFGGVFVSGIIALNERVSSNKSIVQAKRFAGVVLITFALFALYVITNYFRA